MVSPTRLTCFREPCSVAVAPLAGLLDAVIAGLFEVFEVFELFVDALLEAILVAAAPAPNPLQNRSSPPQTMSSHPHQRNPFF